MSIAASALVALGTLAFGAVYPWAYIPLYVAAAALGVAGLVRHRGAGDLRPLVIGLVVVVLAVGVQLCPLPRPVLDAISPGTSSVLLGYELAFRQSSAHPISIRPESTAAALGAFAACALYCVGLAVSVSGRQARRLVRNIALLGAGLAVVGIYGRQHANGLVYGFWRPETTASADTFGPFVNRNHFAGWMLMAIFPSLGLLCGRIETALHEFRGRERAWFAWLSSGEAGKVIVPLVSLVAMTVALVWTLSRSGLASLLCAVLVFAVFVGRREQFRVAERALAIAALGSVVSIAMLWRGFGHVVDWFVHNEDVHTRLLAWQDGWRVVGDFPVAGTGIATYPDAMLFYQQHLEQWWLTHAHNDYLQLLAEGGVLVALPVLALGVVFAIAAGRRLASVRQRSRQYWLRAGAVVGVVAIAAQELVEFSLHIPANALLFATLAAVALAPARESGRLRHAGEASRA